VNAQTKKAVGELVEAVGDAAQDVTRHRWTRRLSRLGFYTKGFLFIVIGGIALGVVFRHRGRFVDTTGALETLAAEPFGVAALLIFAIGGAAHGTWNILRGIADVDGLGGKWHGIVLRCISAGVGIFYLGLAASAFELAISRDIPPGPVRHGTWFSVILEVPLFGAMFVGSIGLGLIGAGFSEAYNGISGRFQRTYAIWKISGMHRLTIRTLGILSFTARALLLLVMGGYFLRAAFRERLGRSIGLDSALHALIGTTYGPGIVSIVALGLIGHGVLAFYEAKYRRIS
jgi:hypothetical protein